MSTSRWMALAGGLVVLSLALGGCGGESGQLAATGGDDGDVILAQKITEYVGDGCATPKPWPGFVPPPADGVDTARIPERLSDGDAPLARGVPRKQVTWFKVQGTTTSCTWVVTMQPTADEDADLYMLEPDGSDYWDGAACLGYSIRTPTAWEGAGFPAYSPDWVAFDTVGPTSGYPSGQVAIYGIAAGASNRHFTIEADKVDTLTVNAAAVGGSVTGGASNWYRFNATAGSSYDVSLTGITDDPDLFVYEDTSIEFVGADTSSTGDSQVTVNLATAGWHYIRVYGYDAGANTYDIDIDSGK